MTRRELLVKGGLGAAALSASGAFAGSAAAKAGPGEASDAYTGTLNMISLGVEWPAGAQAAGREGPRRQVQRPAPEHERPGPEVDHRADELRHRRSLQLPDVPDLADRQLPARRPAQDQGLEGLLPDLHQGQGRPERHVAHLRARATPPFRVIFLDPKGSSGGIGKSTGLPLTKEGPTKNKQIVQWWNEKTNKPDRRQAAAAVGDRRDRRPLQHGLDGLQRRRHQEGARTRSTGASSSTRRGRAASRS